MKKIEKHKNRNEWVSKNDSFDEKLDTKHAKDLGLDIPEDYFSRSKNSILEKIQIEKKSKGTPIFDNKIVWLAAAGIALIMALSIFKPYTSGTDTLSPIVADPAEQAETFGLDTQQFLEQDILIASLFVDESRLDSYVEQYIVEESIIDEYIDIYFFDDMMNDTLLF